MFYRSNIVQAQAPAMTALHDANQTPRRLKRDYRVRSFMLVIAAVLALGYLFSLLPGSGVDASLPQTGFHIEPAGFDQLKGVSQPEQDNPSSEALPDTLSINPLQDPQGSARQVRDTQANAILKQAAAEVESGRHDDAIATLNRGRTLVSDRAEAYLNMGNALLGKRDFDTARDFLSAAIDRNPGQASAYFSFAIASEELGDLESALGAMRSYLHMEKNPDPYRLRVAQARSAIWEWEAKLSRGAWGPTKGVPPGFTAAELRRDGRGVGTKMPIKGSKGPDGQMRYEIKSGAPIKTFKPGKSDKP